MLPNSTVLTPVHNFQHADENVYLTSKLGFKAVKASSSAILFNGASAK